MAQDRITVTEPNGIKRTRPLTAQGLTIGREQDNDLVLAYPAISRRHARITLDGTRYCVTDLGSGNGTFLGESRLSPNTPTPWASERPLRIGDVVINLRTEAASPGVAGGGASGGGDSMTGGATMVWGPGQLAAEGGEGHSKKKKGLPAWAWVLIGGAAILLIAILATAIYLALAG